MFAAYHLRLSLILLYFRGFLFGFMHLVTVGCVLNFEKKINTKEIKKKRKRKYFQNDVEIKSIPQ